MQLNSLVLRRDFMRTRRIAHGDMVIVVPDVGDGPRSLILRFETLIDKPAIAAVILFQQCTAQNFKSL